MEPRSERKRYTLAERDEILDRFDAAGVSAKSFALSEGIKYPTMIYWLKSRREKSRTQSFVEFSDLPAASAECPIEIFLRDGTAIRAFDVATAARVIKELGRAC
jgi:hypothetical protein